MNEKGKTLSSPKLNGLAAVIKGVKKTPAGEHLGAVYRLIKSHVTQNLSTQVLMEIDGYFKKGLIEESTLDKPIVQSTFLELLKFIDEEVPDEERIKTMKAIFLSSAVCGASEEDQKLAYILIRLTKRLDSADILILKAAHKIWSNEVGHNISELVANQEPKLVGFHLFDGSRDSEHEGSGRMRVTNFRLTDLGKSLIEFIITYEDGLK